MMSPEALAVAGCAAGWRAGHPVRRVRTKRHADGDWYRSFFGRGPPRDLSVGPTPYVTGQRICLLGSSMSR
jgi:hypothetical protein